MGCKSYKSENFFISGDGSQLQNIFKYEPWFSSLKDRSLALKMIAQWGYLVDSYTGYKLL